MTQQRHPESRHGGAKDLVNNKHFAHLRFFPPLRFAQNNKYKLSFPRPTPVIPATCPQRLAKHGRREAGIQIHFLQNKKADI